MLNKPAIGFGLLMFFVGCLLVRDAIAAPDQSQTAEVVGGAFCLALGFLVLVLICKGWWQWRQHLKKFRNAAAE